jgi:hypothetical protein
MGAPRAHTAKAAGGSETFLVVFTADWRMEPHGPIGLQPSKTCAELHQIRRPALFGVPGRGLHQ